MHPATSQFSAFFQTGFETAQRRSVLLILLSCVVFAPAQAAPVGKVIFVRGVATAQDAAGTGRIVGRGSPVNETDVLTTGRRSFAVLELTDGSRMTMRPKTAFALERYAHTERQESAVLRLFRGGLRMLTGLISKRNSNGYRVRTKVATIGIRGTEFDVRVCDADCLSEANPPVEKPRARGRPPVARVAFMRGDLKAQAGAAGSRNLVRGGPVYEGDVLSTGRQAFAVLAFRDRSRITLRPNTRFKVERFRAKPARDKPAGGFFRLLRGGLRVLSGLIGKQRPKGYRISTRVATIGIRGTGFDLACGGACAADESAALQQRLDNRLTDLLLRFLMRDAFAIGQPRDGLYARSWKDVIEMILPSGTLLIREGQVGFLANGSTQPVLLDTVPAFMDTDPGTRPDKANVDHDKLFATAPDDGKPAVYVDVRDGHVTLQVGDERLELGRGESGKTDGKVLLRLDKQPDFFRDDPYPIPEDFDAGVQRILDLIRGDIRRSGNKKVLECDVI